MYRHQHVSRGRGSKCAVDGPIITPHDPGRLLQDCLGSSRTHAVRGMLGLPQMLLACIAHASSRHLGQSRTREVDAQGADAPPNKVMQMAELAAVAPMWGSMGRLCRADRTMPATAPTPAAGQAKGDHRFGFSASPFKIWQCERLHHEACT